MSFSLPELNPKKTLLIVDDELDLRELISEMVSPLNCHVRLASQGQEALQIIKSGEIDAVVSDINMPIMNGLQLLSEVRHLSMQTPFVMLSAYGDKANILEALRLNATDFLEKPFKRIQLLEVLDKALRLGWALRQVESELNQLYAGSSLPVDDLIKQREMRRTVMMMKIELLIYNSPAKTS